jgi:hypothetical protein
MSARYELVDAHPLVALVTTHRPANALDPATLHELAAA